MSEILNLYIGSDTLIEVDELTDELTSSLINNATIVGQLHDSSGVQVGTDFTFTASGAEGYYYYILPANTSLDENEVYRVKHTVTHSGKQSIFYRFYRARYL